jgi:ATP sulfurylase
MAFHAEKKKKEKKIENKTKHRNAKMGKRRTTNTTHPGLLRLLSNEDVVLAGPVHRHASRGEEGLEGMIFWEGRGGKRDLNSGLGRAFKYS